MCGWEKERKGAENRIARKYSNCERDIKNTCPKKQLSRASVAKQCKVHARERATLKLPSSSRLPLVFGEFHSGARQPQRRCQQVLPSFYFLRVSGKGLVAQHHVAGIEALPKGVAVEARVVGLVGAVPYFHGGYARVIAQVQVPPGLVGGERKR